MTIDQAVELLREDMLKSVQKIVRYPSVRGEEKPGMPFGEDIDKCYRAAMELAESLGFRVEDFDGYAGHAEMGEGSEIIGVLGHLDTVPHGEGWDLDPCSGEIVDGKLFGRGVLDDKGPAIASLYAVKALELAGVPVNKKIRVVLGLDEETGFGCMDHYLPLAGEPDCAIVPDGNFPVIYGEKGLSRFLLEGSFDGKNSAGVTVKEIRGGERFNMVPDKCMARVNAALDVAAAAAKWNAESGEEVLAERDGEDYVLRTKGISAHGSTPEKGVNAVTIMMRFLATLPLSEELRGAVQVYLGHIVGHHGENLGCALEDDISGKLNCNIGILDYDGAYLKITMNIRFPIRCTIDQVYGGIRENLAGTGYTLTNLGNSVPLYVDPQGPLVSKLMQAYVEVTGDREHEPFTIGGGTYARTMKNAVAFGPAMPGREDVAHQKNEYMTVEDLVACMKIYARALELLLKE